MNNLLNLQPVQLSIPEIIVNLAIAAVLGLITAYLYKRTYRGVSYSQSFVSSLTLVTVIASMVIMVIGNSLARAFGLIGAFTIVRFRTAIKDARDMMFLFLALTLGIAAGTGSHQIGVLGLAAVGALTTFLDRTGFGSLTAYEYVLKFTIKTNQKDNEPYRKIFEKHLKENLLLNVRSLKQGQELELAFNIRLKDPKKLSHFTTELSKVKTISRVELLNATEDLEY